LDHDVNECVPCRSALAELIVHVETGDVMVAVKLSEPVEANGCLYGYLESGTCRSLGE
jgi:hypothetical protein